MWLVAVHAPGLPRSDDFDPDSHGGDEAMQKHDVSKRSRRHRGVLAFVARDATASTVTHVNAGVRTDNQAAEILAFADDCEQRNGDYRSLLVFDSALTTRANLAVLEERGIGS